MALNFMLEETFDAPPEQVTAAIMDVDGYDRWMPNFVRVERLTEGEVGVGARWRETRKLFGKEATEEFEVTAYEPGKRLELFVDGSKGTSKRGEYRFVYELHEHDGGTHMHMEGTIDGMGWFFSLLGKLFAGSFKKAIAKDHAALRAYLEKQQKAEQERAEDPTPVS